MIPLDSGLERTPPIKFPEMLPMFQLKLYQAMAEEISSFEQISDRIVLEEIIKGEKQPSRNRKKRAQKRLGLSPKEIDNKIIINKPI